MAGTEWLAPLVADGQQIKRESVWRARDYQELSVPNALVDEYVEKGWQVSQERVRKSKIRKLWPHDQRLENKVWYLFYLLGYPELSSGRTFKIRIERPGADPLEKQIDVFAKDDETVIVTECKSCATITKRSLQKDIEEFASLKGPIAHAIHAHYGPGFKPKIIWMFVTENIAWSDPDKQRATGNQISVVTERELRYYLEIAKHLRSAARFQFLAEFLQNQKIPEMKDIRVPAVRGKLGGHRFYSFVSTPEQMLKIAFVNHRTLNDPQGAPTYQRLVESKRLRQVSGFLKNGGFFPTNILVNFKDECRFEKLAKDEETGVVFGRLYLPDKYRSAWVIDGQHRLYGYAALPDDFLSQHIMVVAFENLSPEEEANLFVQINHEQRRVSKSLLDDLEGELKWNSDKPSERIGAISSRLIHVLNSDIGGPLYERVTRTGLPATQKACLTVPQVKMGLAGSGLVGTSVMKGLEYSPGPLCGVDDFETLDRARAVLTAYFDQLREANFGQWEAGKSGVLCTNTSVQAHLRFLGSLIAFVQWKTRLTARHLQPLELMSEVDAYLAPVLSFIGAASDREMAEAFKVPFGSGGVPAYYYRLCKLVHDKHLEFAPDGFDEWLESQSQERVDQADRQIKELQKMVQKFTFDRLRERYGVEGDAYFYEGVVDKTIITKAFSKSLDDSGEERLALEDYLDFIDYRKIVERKENWPLFRPIFDIPEPGEKGHVKNLKWIDRINSLRRIPAHPGENRNYKSSDFGYIDRVYNEVRSRIEAFESRVSEQPGAGE